MSNRVVSLVVLLCLFALAAFLAPLAQAEGGEQTAVTLPSPLNAQTQPVDPESEQATLPGELGRIFAALSVFIVTMFTMAIGTEIVVDVFKLLLGLQSRPSALKTMENYEKMLPGTLANLGLSIEAQQKLEHQLADLKRLLQPVFQVEQAVVDIQSDSLRQTLEELLGPEATAEQIAKASERLKGRMRHTVDQLARHLSLPETAVTPLLTQLDNLVDQSAQHLEQLTPQDILRQANRLINDNLADPITAWTRAQIETLQGKAYAQARLEYEKLTPHLEQSGLSEQTIREVKVQLESYLEQLRLAELGELHLEALNTLLSNVERQRNHMRTRVRAAAEWLQKRLLPGRHAALVAERQRRETEPTIPNLQQAAGQLLELERRDGEDRANYIYAIRLLSVVIGVGLAYMLRVDAAELMTNFLPDSASFLTTEFRLLPGWPTMTAGIILTGLAASAGSGFWHDQLNRLRQVQKGAEAAYAALQPVIVNQKLESGQN